MKYFSILTIIAIVAIAFKGAHTVPVINAGDEVQIDAIAGQSPFLTKDQKGNTVMSWVRMINDTSSVFCYAVSTDSKSFGQPVIIPNSNNIKAHGENLPKMIFKPTGEIIALWGSANPNPKNQHSGQVFYSQSFDEGKTWSEAKPLVSDTASYDQRYYDVALLKNGEVGIIWLDNRKTTDKEGSGLFFATTNGKNGFGEGKLISEQCCQCCRTDLYVDHNGGIHALYRGIVHDSIRDMVHIVSVDGGKTFTTPERISKDNWILNGCPHTGPAMTENEEGIHFAWFTGGKEKGCFYTRTTDNGKTFIAKDSVSLKGSHPQLTALPNRGLLVAWDETAYENNQVVKKIGIQKRTATGKAEVKQYITSTGTSSYPVIQAVNETSAIVAYTKTVYGKSFVAYKVVTVQ
jgi:hypothetical protein